MELRTTRAALLAASLSLLCACSSVPTQDSRQRAQALLRPASGTLASAAEGELHGLLSAPLDTNGAIRVAWLRSPDAQSAYAQLGVSAADVFTASRPANPGLSLSVLWPTHSGADRKLDGALGFGLGDLLWLPSRRRAGAFELRAAEQRLAASLYTLALDAEAAWIDAVGAQQRLAVRRFVAESAQVAAELAEQYRQAGNVNALAATLQAAAGTEARIALADATREASRSRAHLRQVLGLTAADPLVQLPDTLPALEPVAADSTTLHAQAHAQRLDLIAARSEVEAASVRLAATRRYRLLSGSELGVLAEREGETRRAGASAGVSLPVFSQGQGAVARAAAELQAAQSRVHAIEVAIDAEVDTQLEQLGAAREQYQQYREQLIPQREAAVARLTEQANFMLVSPFELLLARQQSYSAYEGAVAALQSWWQARIALTRALGAPFPAPAKE